MTIQANVSKGCDTCGHGKSINLNIYHKITAEQALEKAKSQYTEQKYNLAMKRYTRYMYLKKKYEG